jgi:iron complex outermembrane receptor protein
LQERLVGKGLYNGQLIEGVNIADNHLPAVWYTDLTVTARFKALSTQDEVFLTVNNLFNKKPPPSPVPSTFMKGADGSRYDVIGRYVTMGVRVQY